MTMLNKMHMNQFTFDGERLSTYDKRKINTLGYEIGGENCKKSFNDFKVDSSK